MKKSLLILLFGVLLILTAVFFFYADMENETNNKQLSQEQREALVSTYIAKNVSQLSPESAVLGGTFYVTDITFYDSNTGTVEYEDGHIALLADFKYIINQAGTVEVEFYNVREDHP